MTRETMPLRSLSYFLAVTRAGSVALAAKELGVTPSAISHQIKALETWLGGQVLDRSTRSVRLTPIGRVLRDGTDAGIAQAARVMAATREASVPGRIVVSAPPAFAALRLPVAVEMLRISRPDIYLDIRTVAFNAPVEADVVHIAIRFLHGDDEGGRRLGERGWSAVCTPASLAALGHPAHVSDLTHALLAHERVYNFWPERLVETATFARDLTFLALDDLLAVVGAALSGAAIGLVPREISRGLWRDGALVAIAGGDVEPKAAFYAIPTEAGMLKPGIEDVLNLITATFQ